MRHGRLSARYKRQVPARYCPDYACAEESALSMTFSLAWLSKQNRCLCLPNGGGIQVPGASPVLSFPFCRCLTLNRRERRKDFQCRCHETAAQGMTRPGQPEPVQGVTGKAVQTTLLVCHPMNPHRNPFPGGYVANKVTSGKCLYSRCQKAFPCAAKYTNSQRVQERMPVAIIVKSQTNGQTLHMDNIYH